jgi:hypothetical protein
MQKSESIKHIAQALIIFHVKVDTIKKDAKNPFFKSTYASLSNILDAINEPLIESDLTVSQFPTGDNGLTTILIHGVSGEWIQSTYEMKPVKDDPQGRGSCITYQRRYALASVLSLNIDEDDDGNKASRLLGEGGIGFIDTPQKPWLNKNSDEFAKAHAYMLDKGDINKIKAKYRLSKEVETLLTTK